MKGSVYDLVKYLLTKKPELRDSDKKLIWEVFRIALSRDTLVSITEEELFSLPSTETIRRSRAKIQETHIELRGSNYIEQKRKEKELEKGTFIYREQITPQVLDIPLPVQDTTKPKNSLIWGN